MSAGDRASPFGSLISATELATLLREPDVSVLDVRWYLDDHAKGRRMYANGHIPGAVFIDLERDITGVIGKGRHPLPTREQFEAAMRRAGVHVDDRVVVYDDAGGSVAARLWWLLRIHGHPAAAVLDGGLQAWDGPRDLGEDDPVPGTFVAAEPDLSDVLAYEEVASLGTDSLLLDVRAPERFRGEVEPVDPIAGHIPGARNAFWQDTLMAGDGTLHAPDELRQRFEALGVRPGNAVVYCGSGVVATQTLLAIEHAGLGPVRIYAGGWSDWSNHEGAPIETGD